MKSSVSILSVFYDWGKIQGRKRKKKKKCKLLSRTRSKKQLLLMITIPNLNWKNTAIEKHHWEIKNSWMKRKRHVHLSWNIIVVSNLKSTTSGRLLALIQSATRGRLLALIHICKLCTCVMIVDHHFFFFFFFALIYIPEEVVNGYICNCCQAVV